MIVDALRTTRPINVGLTFCSVLLGGWLSNGATATAPLLIAGLSASLIAAAGYTHNDILDLETDLINHPHRSLPQGQIDVRSAAIISVLGYGSALLLCLWLPSICLVMAICITATLVVYNHGLKHTPLLGNLLVGCVGGCPFVFGGVAAMNPGPAVLPGILAATFHFTREILKDIQDRRGDALHAGRTFPTIAGEGPAKGVVSGLLALLIVTIPLPTFWGMTGPVYLAIGLVLDALLLFVICQIWVAKNDHALEAPSRTLKLGMVMGLLAFLLDHLE